MLRVTIHSSSKTLRFVVEGRLEGAHVIELEKCWRTTVSSPGSPILVDLVGVTHIDGAGKRLLIRLHERGAELLATGIMTKQVVEEIIKT